MFEIKLPPEISINEEDLKKAIEQALKAILPVPIDKFIILDPPKKKEVMDFVVSDLQDLRVKIPESSSYLDAAIQSFSEPNVYGQETGTYSNEGQAIGCAVGAALGGALGAGLGPMGAMAAAGLGCAMGSSMGRALGERRKFAQQ